MPFAAELQYDPGQASKATQHMDCMNSGEHIKKGAVWVGGQIQALGSEFEPCEVLAHHKKQTKQHGGIQPEQGHGADSLSTSHESGNARSRALESDAA